MQEIVINPFSTKSKKIVKNAPPLHELPEDVFELAKAKVVWKKTDKRPPEGILNLESKKDVLSYHLLFLSAGLNFSEYSNEVRLVKDALYEITKGRLAQAYKTEGENFRWRFDDKFVAEEVPGEGLQKSGYKVPWKSLLPLIGSRELRLGDWDVSDGQVYSNRVRLHKKDRKLGTGDLIEMYSHLIACEAADYMSSLFKGGKDKGEVLDYLKSISDVLQEVSAESYKASFAGGKSKKFAPENFPPCIQGVLRGVSSGSRNYAISVLLTSFLSYARAAPEKVDNPRLVDFIKEPSILLDEIMPLIYQAAQMCQPPLFEDQPLEKMNITYHLGMGLTEDAKLENSGASKWYFPPNCEKVRREAPALCKPGALCERIKNPLTYYFIKMKDAEEGERGRVKKVEEKPEIKEETSLPKVTIIDIIPGSGLITRCPECKRVLIHGMCAVHGEVEGIQDLRVKAKVDNGKTMFNILMVNKIAEDATEINLEEAKKMGELATLEAIKKALIGKVFEIDGVKMERHTLIKYVKRV